MAEEYATSVKLFLLDIWSFVFLYSSNLTSFWKSGRNYLVHFKVYLFAMSNVMRQDVMQYRHTVCEREPQ
jgi:hypothetical protein